MVARDPDTSLKAVTKSEGELVLYTPYWGCLRASPAEIGVPRTTIGNITAMAAFSMTLRSARLTEPERAAL